jgi:putative ABC transport system permease protein
MIRSYFRSAFRLLFKDQLYPIINAFGLAVGMATCFLIFSWVLNEVSYDTVFPDADRIYRVVTQQDDGDGAGIASTYPMLHTRVLSQFPEVESSARLFDQGFLGSKTRVAYGDKVLTNLRFYYGDSTALPMFGFQTIFGDSKVALTRPNTVVLTRATAEKFFGSENPVGKVLRVGRDRDMEVTAVIEDLPDNIHFHFDMLASMLSHPWIKGAEENLWSGVVFHTYVKLREANAPEELESKIKSVLDNFPNDPTHYGRGIDLRLQPIQSIHLQSNMKFELEANGNALYVYLFVTIAVLVLGVAMINYVNLATARHTQRYKEVGVRKVLGAKHGQLVVQFLAESSLVILMAFCGAVLLVEAARPWLFEISGKQMFAASFLQWEILLTAASVALLIGLATAIFPALALSGLRPVSLFRPSSQGGRGPGLRKALMVIQFGVSLVLTFCTAITWKQIVYLREAALGYSKDHVVVLDVSLAGVRENLRTIKQAYLSIPGVTGVTATSQLPTDIQTGENIDASPSQSLGVYCVSVDPDFFKVLGISLVQSDGRLNVLEPNDSINSFVLNQQAAEALGWTNQEAVGRRISIRHGNQRPGPVLAVAEDFHFQSLHNAVGPLAIEFNPYSYQYLLVKVQPVSLSVTLEELKKHWQRLAGGAPFDYQFLDEQYDRLYRAEHRSGNLFVGFACIAVFVSLLGLFGLASFTLERRTKEMGVRKILGAENWRIAVLISKDFLVLMAIAFALALPLGYAYQKNWMSQFAYQADVGFAVFLACGVLNVLLALLTLLYHTMKISRTNPVESLRWE